MNEVPVALCLPDAWRMTLLLTPERRDEWLTALAALPAWTLLDWEQGRPPADGVLFCPTVDLAAAELLVKLDAGQRVAACRGAVSAELPGGRRAFLARATARVTTWIELDAGPTLPAGAASWLGRAARLLHGGAA